MSILLLTKIYKRFFFFVIKLTLGVLVYKEPSWKYTFPISHPHTRDLHFTPSNFFLLLSYHSLTSHYFLSHLCSLFCLLLLFIFIFFRPSHDLPLLHQSVLHLFFRCVCSFHLVQVFFISFFSLFSFLFHLVC